MASLLSVRFSLTFNDCHSSFVGHNLIHWNFRMDRIETCSNAIYCLHLFWSCRRSIRILQKTQMHSISGKLFENHPTPYLIPLLFHKMKRYFRMKTNWNIQFNSIQTISASVFSSFAPIAWTPLTTNGCLAIDLIKRCPEPNEHVENTQLVRHRINTLLITNEIIIPKWFYYVRFESWNTHTHSACIARTHIASVPTNRLSLDVHERLFSGILIICRFVVCIKLAIVCKPFDAFGNYRWLCTVYAFV